jgi:hypothetical protein
LLFKLARGVPKCIPRLVVRHKVPQRMWFDRDVGFVEVDPVRRAVVAKRIIGRLLVVRCVRSKT